MANEYFQPGSVPAPNSPGSSAIMRNEFGSVAAAFDKLPIMSGNPNEIVVVNGSGTALVTSGTSLGDYVTKDGVFTLTNKTIAWADNTFPGFGTGATKNAGSAAGEVPVLAGASLLPALDGSLLTNLNVNQAGTIVDIAHGGTGANTYAGAQATLGINLKADANSAVLTGAPTAPHPPTGNDSARIATTHFVQETVTAIGGFGPGVALPQMNGVASAGVSALGSRDDHVHPVDTSRAPTSASTAVGTSFTPTGGIAATDVQGALQELDAEKANLVSPVFSGDPRAPTPTAGNSDTSIATTAFVQAAIAPFAPLASPVFTGDPKAPTPATSDNDTSIATTAFVQSLLAQQPPGVQVSNSSPLMNGAVAPGTGVEASRYDHVHPADTSRAPSSAATATGTSFAPAGNIAATNVQAAIAELDTEKVSKTGDTMTGTLKAPMLQAGVSVTPANNFVLNPSANNGTMRLARESGTDIMTVDAASKVNFTVGILGFSFGSSGTGNYIKVPSWLGGWTVQWGVGATSGLIYDFNYPTAFTAAGPFMLCCERSAAFTNSPGFLSCNSLSMIQGRVCVSNGATAPGTAEKNVAWLAIGK